jgi:hypothetical protein
MTYDNIKNRIKPFKIFVDKIEIWRDLNIWTIQNENYYSDWMKQEIKRLKPIVIEFVKEGYYKKVCEKHDVEYSFLRKFAFGIAEFKKIIKALKYANGYRGKIGLELAIAEIKLNQKKNNKMPTSHDNGIKGIMSAISRGTWSKFGINSWNDILIQTFGKANFITNKYIGKAGFQNALTELKDFREKKKILPTMRDKEMLGIIGAISRGAWKDFGIKTWNELLTNAFGKINREFSKYGGLKGMNIAVNELKQFNEDFGRIPKSREVRSISEAVYNEYWKDLGINTWNDLLMLTFGKINLPRGIYTGKNGLSNAIEKMKAFKIKEGRIPKIKDVGMSGIEGAIKLKYWIDFGIRKWNDLLMRVFGKINKKS